MTTTIPRPVPTGSAWRIGGTVFAAAMMMLPIGAFHTVPGLVALMEDEFTSSRGTTPSSST